MPTQSESGVLPFVAVSSTGQPDSPVIRTGASGGNGGGDMTVDVTSYIDSKIETVRAQNDTRFEQVLAKLDVVQAAIKNVPTTATVIWSTFIGAAAIIGVLLAAFTLAGDWFATGAQVTSYTVEQAVETQEIAAENAKRIEALSEQAVETDRKLNVIIQLLDERADR